MASSRILKTRRFFTISMASLAAMLLAFPLSAGAISLFIADLDGLQEVPPHITPATGFGTVLLNDAETLITVDLTFSDLLGPETAAHLHGPAPAGVNAGVLIPLPLGTFVGFTSPITPSQVDFLKDGLMYFNVHTTIFPGGEIRGQVVRVTEPTTLLLLGSSLVALGLWGRKKFKRC